MQDIRKGDTWKENRNIAVISLLFLSKCGVFQAAKRSVVIQTRKFSLLYDVIYTLRDQPILPNC